MSDTPCLPPELWRIIIRLSTSTRQPISESREYSLLGPHSREEPPCLKNDAPLTPVLYHRKENKRQSAMEAFTQAGSKRAIALVCRSFNQLVTEFLFEKLYISDPRSAHQLADTLEASSIYETPGKWTRHITIVGVFFTWPSASSELAAAALRILSHTPHLQSFHISWNSISREFRARELRAHEEQIIASVPTSSLRHFEWDCTGGGFERQHDHAFYRLLRCARPTLRVLKLSGYLPLSEMATRPSQELAEAEGGGGGGGGGASLPELTHLKIRRAFRDDLLFVSQWDISARLTCLSLGNIWAYFDHREVAFAFWDTPKPALRCLHLGEGSSVSTQLAHKIMHNSPVLKTLEYFYLGDWDARTWASVQHESLETVKVHVSHPMIALRSLFNSERFSRDQQWQKILRHVGPFLGRSTSDSETLHENADYSAMKKLTFLEYSRKLEDIRYDPAELAEWLRVTIRESEIETEVELSVEVADYIR